MKNNLLCETENASVDKALARYKKTPGAWQKHWPA